MPSPPHLISWRRHLPCQSICNSYTWTPTGASTPPEVMMHFPLFHISPLFSKNFKTLWKISKMLPFPEKNFDFHPPKFLMTFFLIIDHKFQISTPLLLHFPP